MTDPAILRRQFEREKRARQEAEQLLEAKSLELFEAKEAAEASRAQLHDAIESISQGFLLFDSDEKLILANSRYREFYPHIADLLTPGRPMQDLVEAHARAGGAAGNETNSDGFVTDRMERFRNQGGEAWEQLQPDGRTMLINEKRTVSGGLVSVRTDITALKKAELLLRNRLAAIEAAEEGIAITDSEGNFVYMNQEHLRMFGYESLDEVAGQPWKMLYSPEVAATVERDCFPAVMRDGSWRGEAYGLRRDGTSFPQEVSLTLLEDGGLICATRDITARIENEKQKSLLQDQFKEAQKMEAIGRLAGGIAHDFNNILAAMLGYASFLVEDLEPESELQGFASQIVSSGERAKKLVQQLLAFSRHRESGFEPTDIAELTSAVIDMLRPTIPANIGLQTDIRPAPGRVNGNPTQIEQVLINLVVNARDAMEGAPGEIALTVESGDTQSERQRVLEDKNPDLAADKIGVAGGPDGQTHAWLGRIDPNLDYVCLRVRDNGSGIDAATMEKLFEPFFTTKSLGKGTGLGLAAVQGIILAHEGALVVNSRVGYGTEFVMFLPILDSAEDSPAEQVEIRPEVSAIRNQILLVDDEPDVLSMLATAMARSGYAPVPVASGPQALEALADPAHNFVAVVTDFMMPDMTGLELTRRIRVSHPGLPIIMCTGYSEDVEKAQVLADGANAFLRKPVSVRDIVDAIEAVRDEVSDQAR